MQRVSASRVPVTLIGRGLMPALVGASGRPWWLFPRVLATNYAPANDGPTLSTWLFLGGLALTAGVVLLLFRWSISGYRPPEPRGDLVEVDPFWVARDHLRQVDLGNGWRSVDDPYAMWHLWSLPTRRELVGMRMAAMPHPAAMGLAGRSGKSFTGSGRADGRGGGSPGAVGGRAGPPARDDGDEDTRCRLRLPAPRPLDRVA